MSHPPQTPRLLCYAKQKNVATAQAAPDDEGDVWAWTAIEADSKPIVFDLVGSRDAGNAHEFMQDVAARLTNRVQLTTRPEFFLGR